MFAVQYWRALSSVSRHSCRTTSTRFLAVGTGSTGSKSGANDGTEPTIPAQDHSDEIPDIAEDNEEVENGKPEMVDAWNKDAPAGPEWSGPRGYEPTRYGDWSKNGRVSDF